MLYIGYLIFVNDQNIKKIGFGLFPFLRCRGRKTALAGCAPAPLRALERGGGGLSKEIGTQPAYAVFHPGQLKTRRFRNLFFLIL